MGLHNVIQPTYCNHISLLKQSKKKFNCKSEGSIYINIVPITYRPFDFNNDKCKSCNHDGWIGIKWNIIQFVFTCNSK